MIFGEFFWNPINSLELTIQQYINCNKHIHKKSYEIDITNQYGYNYPCDKIPYIVTRIIVTVKKLPYLQTEFASNFNAGVQVQCERDTQAYNLRTV